MTALIGAAAVATWVVCVSRGGIQVSDPGDPPVRLYGLPALGLALAAGLFFALGTVVCALVAVTLTLPLWIWFV